MIGTTASMSPFKVSAGLQFTIFHLNSRIISAFLFPHIFGSDIMTIVQALDKQLHSNYIPSDKLESILLELLQGLLSKEDGRDMIRRLDNKADVSDLRSLNERTAQVAQIGLDNVERLKMAHSHLSYSC